MIQALVLKVRDYRETSVMVSLFTAEQGRINAVFKGARRPRQARRVETFCLADVDLYGRGGLLNLGKYEFQYAFALHGDRLAAGYYVLELIVRALGERQVERAIYEQCLISLTMLEQGNVIEALRRFERRMLEELGYAFDCSVDALRQAPVIADQHYLYEPGLGMVTASSAANAFSGRALQAVAAQDYGSPEAQVAARKIYQQALQPLIGDGPLISRSMLHTTSKVRP